MAWESSLSTYIWIFAVGRGNAAFIRTGLNQGFILDMNASEFDVADFIKKRFVPKLDAYKGNKIAQAVLSHPHADHIAQCSELETRNVLYPTLLTCPHDKDFKDGTPSDEKLNWGRIRNQDRDKEIVASYKRVYDGRHLPLQTIQYSARWSIPNLEYGLFFIRPPVCEMLHPSDDNAYGNCTSMVFYLRHGSNSILFPGDMTPEGMKHILDEGTGVEKRYTVFDSQWSFKNSTQHESTHGQPSLRSLLNSRGLTVLVAPHHGLESCYSQDLFDAIKGGKPRLVVISERRHTHENDGKTHQNYQSGNHVIGTKVLVEGQAETKISLTTKNGHHTLAVFDSSGAPKIFADRDPDRLLTSL
jgi:beta-lactamase superfamily II metal-dependent hydrolase